MLKTFTNRQDTVICWRMFGSRACDMAGAFGCTPLRLDMMRC